MRYVCRRYADYHFFSRCTRCCLRRRGRWSRVTASDVPAATEIQVGQKEHVADATAALSIGRLTTRGRWLTAALLVNAMATVIWMLSAHANRINQQNAEATRLGRTHS